MLKWPFQRGFFVPQVRHGTCHVTRQGETAMHDTTREATEGAQDEHRTFVEGMLRGYRFRVCETPRDAARALDVRRRVYRDGSGYPVPVPDQYDHRAWLLAAEDCRTGATVGTVRVTPRFAGPVEAEEYLDLPRRLATRGTYEISRFAILPEYRKGKTFLPTVSLGLFKLVHEVLETVNASHMVICSKPERIWTYEWMRFKRTGVVARYTKLGGAEHELLWYDFRRRAKILAGHPFGDFFVRYEYDEVVVPNGQPPFGLVEREPADTLPIAVGA
jgi:hypothetical protein